DPPAVRPNPDFQSDASDSSLLTETPNVTNYLLPNRGELSRCNCVVVRVNHTLISFIDCCRASGACPLDLGRHCVLTPLLLVDHGRSSRRGVKFDANLGTPRPRPAFAGRGRGGSAGTRTQNPRLKRPLLYH